MIHIIYKICIDQCFLSSERLLVNSRLLVKFWESQKLICRFSAAGFSAPNPVLFEGQLNTYRLSFTFFKNNFLLRCF